MFGRRSTVDAWGIQKRASPAPINVLPSGNFAGNDGNWSTFSIRVGTPAQNTDVLISTLSTELWAVGSFACSSGGNSDPDCVSSRGGDPSLFDSSSSTTWSSQGAYSYAIDTTIGVPRGQGGNYGYDTVGLFTADPNSGAVLNHQVVSTFSMTDIWIGLFGLSPRMPNFNTTTNNQTSFLTSLYNATKIPSLSYSYTAGAYYRSKTNASLTLGGYDSSRFTDPGLYLNMAPDPFRDLVVGLQSIQYSDQNGGKSTIMDQGILAMVDTTVAPLWLPQSACDNFANAFGLTTDSLTQLYVVNSTQHDTNVKNNATVDFIIGSNISGGQNTKISFPYAAFDLYFKNPTSASGPFRYFPLRVASKSTQYTLGRTFLQEAVLTADYGRSNFTIAQALPVTATTKSNIVTITNSTTATSSLPSTPGGGGNGNGDGSFVAGSSGGSNAAAIGGGVGGGLGGALIIALLLFFCCWRPRQKKKKEAEKGSEVAAPAAVPTTATAPAPNTFEKDGVTNRATHGTGSPAPPYSAANDYFGKPAAAAAAQYHVNRSNAASPAITPAISEPHEMASPSTAQPPATATVNNLGWSQWQPGGPGSPGNLHPNMAGAASPSSASSSAGPTTPAFELAGSEARHNRAEMASPGPADVRHEMPSPQPSAAELWSPTTVSSGRISPAVPVSAVTPTAPNLPVGTGSNSAALAPAPVMAAAAEPRGINHQAQRSSTTLPAHMQPTMHEPMPSNATSQVTAAELASRRDTILSEGTDTGTDFRPSPDVDGHPEEYFHAGDGHQVSRNASLMSATGQTITSGRAQMITHQRTASSGDINRIAGPSIPEGDETEGRGKATQ